MDHPDSYILVNSYTRSSSTCNIYVKEFSDGNVSGWSYDIYYPKVHYTYRYEIENEGEELYGNFNMAALAAMIKMYELDPIE